MDIQEAGCDMDRIGLTLNRDRWPAFVKAVMNFKAIHFVIFISKCTV